jgi:hypothetical protein
VEQPPQPPQPPPEQPQPRPWGGQPWGQQPRPAPPPRQWGQPPAPRQPWGYRPPQPPGPRPPQPWYRHPVGMALIGAVVVIVLALVVPVFTGGGGEPAPTVTTGAFGGPGTTVPRAATTTSAAQPVTPADRLGQAIQDELGGAGTVTEVTLPPGGPVTVTWEIARAGSPGLTRNNARFGVMRILRAIQQTNVAAGGDAPAVRLLGRYQLEGTAAPVTVVRLRVNPATLKQGNFDDRRYLEAFELADVAVIHPAFQG